MSNKRPEGEGKAIEEAMKNSVLKLFEEQRKKLTDEGKTTFKNTLEPFQKEVERLYTALEKAREKGTEQHVSLLEQVKQLTELNMTVEEETRNLTSALKGGKNNKFQGNWGEMILERLLESSGLVRGKGYETQVSLTSDDGKRYQPDIVVYLPQERHIIVDAKVSLSAYEECVSAENETDKVGAFKRHVQSLERHVKELAEKRYFKLNGIHSPDFSVMFIPIDGALMLHDNEYKKLMEMAWSEKIMITVPATLMVVLSTVASLWRTENQMQNAEAIAKAGGMLHDKFAGLLDDLRDVRSRLGKAQEAVEGTFTKIEGHGGILGQVKKLEELGAKTGKKITPKLIP